MKLGEFAKKEILTCEDFQNVKQLYERMLAQSYNFILVMSEGKVQKLLTAQDVVRSMLAVETGTVDSLQESRDFTVLSAEDDFSNLANVKQDMVVILGADSQPLGVIDCVQAMANLLHANHQKEVERKELENIIHFIEEEIFITDGEGRIVFLNPTAEKVCGFTKEEVIGKHVSYLEKKRMVSPSITKLVLQTKGKVNILQQVKTGKTVLGTAVPIFDEQGEITRVICTSKDVVEINNLLNKIEKQNRELASKEQQVDLMRQALFGQHNFACFTKGLEKLKETVIKIAPTDLTVLIQGESGVGKEIATKLIHSLSSRNKFPLIKINCGLIPENLIESELFGYENGAFTGANKNGKIGKIELANKGTLFLDEIGEMPLNLQVKLLEFLQDREITRIGGSKRIAVDTRIIAATNRDLKDMVHQGNFREDLYYRLSVFPIRIAPLRERKEDIATLAEYFLQKFNDKYKLNKVLAAEALDVLLRYDWPGNVRELEHAIERAVVCSNLDVIRAPDLDTLSEYNQQSYGKVICTGLLPWKLAQKELKDQLIKRAYDCYKSTYKAAKVLEVSQSTVAKILKNLTK